MIKFSACAIILVMRVIYQPVPTSETLPPFTSPSSSSAAFLHKTPATHSVLKNEKGEKKIIRRAQAASKNGSWRKELIQQIIERPQWCQKTKSTNFLRNC